MIEGDLLHVIETDLEANSGSGCLRALERVLELHPFMDETRVAVLDELHTDAPPPAPGHRGVPATRPRPARRPWVLRRRDCVCGRNTAIHPNGALYRHRCRSDGGLLGEEVTACPTPP